MIKTNRISKYLGILLSISLIHNILAIKGMAHAPEFHLRQETPPESTESQTEKLENKIIENSVEDLKNEVLEAEVDVLPASDLVENSFNNYTQNSLKTFGAEVLIIWILINPFFLYYLKSKLFIKNTRPKSRLQ